MRPRVLLVASEAIPLVKTGGLADVISSMVAALRKNNVDVTLLMPGYPAAMEGVSDLAEVAPLPGLPGGPGRLCRGHIREAQLPVLLLDTPSFRRRALNPYVDTDGHEYPDNAEAFAALAHAAVRICAGKTPLPVPDIVHAHDWHAGLIPALLRAENVRGVGSVLTVHNLAFQGNYPLSLAPALGLPERMLGSDGVEFWGKLSFLKAGLRFADRISIVSQTYANEVLTPQFGCGMDPVLNERKADIRSIPNGVDVDLWNPASDPMIVRNFSRHDLRNKRHCKQELLKLFGLPAAPEQPLLAIGSRITHQKMADVALAALPHMLDKHPQLRLVVLGKGEHDFERGFLALAERYPERVGVHIGYDEQRAHALHAGADMLLHGTRFEPFGLTPIYAMRYGTIPVASRVGGLTDTIVDTGPHASGLLFEGEQASDMCAAVDRALALYGSAERWLALQRNAMSGDFSWDGPARGYIEMYREIAAPSAHESFRRVLRAKREASVPALAVVA